MSYSVDRSHDARSFTRGRRGRMINGIVIHHWGIDGQSHSGVVNFFEKTAPTSAHYVVSSDLVSILVDLKNTAYHAGDWGANLSKIGIECRPEMSDGDFETVAELIADIRNVYGKLKLTGHKQYKSTSCPGRWHKQLSRLSKRAEQIRKGSSAKPTKPKPVKKPKATRANKNIQKALIAMGINVGYPDGVNGPKQKAKVKYFQRAHGLVQDGYWGKKTQAKWRHIKEVQTLLRKHGYTKQTVDGFYGNQTEFNVRDFQKRTGLVNDGVAGPITMKRLRA